METMAIVAFYGVLLSPVLIALIPTWDDLDIRGGLLSLLVGGALVAVVWLLARAGWVLLLAMPLLAAVFLARRELVWPRAARHRAGAR